MSECWYSSRLTSGAAGLRAAPAHHLSSRRAEAIQAGERTEAAAVAGREGGHHREPLRGPSDEAERAPAATAAAGRLLIGARMYIQGQTMVHTGYVSGVPFEACVCVHGLHTYIHIHVTA